MRGLQVGSAQDAAFTNSFNLTFSGSLGDELSFKGALSEESAPLQPEGNTQTLRDIDRIFVEFRAKDHFAVTIGDFPLSLSHIRLDSIPTTSLYDNITRKVLGAMATVQAGPTAVATSYSVTKGQFTSNALQGIDGVQGPYRLSGRNGEQAIIIIAGTEHIYLDGELLLRGEQNDYVIDYGLAQVQFTTKRIITSFSRITIDFEYTDEQYSRNLFAAKQVTSLFGNAALFSTTYLREGDDQNNPKELILTDSDKAILARAGNDPLKATKSGVVFVGKDSISGKARGSYIAVDSVISAVAVHFFRYSPLDSINAFYTVGFGFAGTGKGQYIRKSIGEFDYVGMGNGDYDTLIFLPLPQLHELFGGKLSVVPFPGLNLTGEGAATGLTQNRFSSLAAENGNAYNFGGSYVDTFSIAGMKSVSIEVSGKQLFTSALFSPFDRIRSVESMRQYGKEDNSYGTTMLGQDEKEQTFSSRISISRFTGTIDVGTYSLGGTIYKAQHYKYGGLLNSNESSLPNIIASYEVTPVTDSANGITSNWRSVNALVNKAIKDSTVLYIPSFAFNYGERQSRALSAPFSSDSLTLTSFRYIELAPSLGVRFVKQSSISLSYTFRADDSSRYGRFFPISRSSQFLVGSSLFFDNGFSGKFDVGYHARTFRDSISKSENGGDNTSLLVHLVPRYHTMNNAFSIDADYQVSELRTAALQRLFFPVQPGQGNYMYVGDLNHNGKQDPEEFQLARYSDQGTYILLTIPTDQLRPTVDLHTLLHLRFAPASLAQTDVLHILSPLSFETVVRLDENSTDERTSDIYFFHLSRFLNDSTTIHGLQEYQQDIFLFENNVNSSFRFRWNDRKSASEFNTGLERTYHRELSLRARLRPWDELTTEEIVSYVQDNVSSNEFSANRPQQTKRYQGESNISFDPFASRASYALSVSYESIADPLYLVTSNASIDAIKLSMRYGLSSTLSLNAETSRNEFAAHIGSDQILPFGLSAGLSPGVTWGWSLGANQEITRGVLLNIKYEGRSEPSISDRHITHIGRAEIRASF